MSYNITVGGTTIEASLVTPSVAVYNCTVAFVRMTKVNSSTGQTETPVTLITLMSHIKWLNGNEKILFNKETHYLDAILKCRTPAGITLTVTDKVYYNSEYYEIVDLYSFNNLGTLLVIGIKKIK